MKLTVILVNTWRTHMAIVHENSYLPYTRRTVQIDLTREQAQAILPRELGMNGGKVVREEIGEVWLEPDD